MQIILLLIWRPESTSDFPDVSLACKDNMQDQAHKRNLSMYSHWLKIYCYKWSYHGGKNKLPPEVA